MPKLYFLGTANAIPDESHENTHLAVVGNQCFIIIDCAGNPVVRLKQAGLDILRVTDMILTHFHPDHVSGVAPFLMSSWLMGREDLLKIYGLNHTLERVQKLMDSYEWGTWPDFYPVEFHALPEKPLAKVLENDEFLVYASPVQHMVPGIGLRFEILQTGRVVAYSSDTAPCEEVIDLARNADVLIHEASGASTGHTSAAQAGEIARQAGAKSLYIIHYQTREQNPHELVEEARRTFTGAVTLAEDFMWIEI